MTLRRGVDGVLVVIDVQEVFRHDVSPWGAAGFDAVHATIAGLVDRFSDRVVFTRFVPPELVEGSWESYYDRWPFAVDATSSWWQLAEPWRGRTSIDVPTFSKWGAHLACYARAGHELVLTGVTTDCCVLATVLAAVDGGAHVALVADACAGSTAALHQAAIDIVERRSPQARVITTADLKGEPSTPNHHD